jgi:hypothetical protein
MVTKAIVSTDRWGYLFWYFQSWIHEAFIDLYSKNPNVEPIYFQQPIWDRYLAGYQNYHKIKHSWNFWLSLFYGFWSKVQTIQYCVAYSGLSLHVARKSSMADTPNTKAILTVMNYYYICTVRNIFKTHHKIYKHKVQSPNINKFPLSSNDYEKQTKHHSHTRTRTKTTRITTTYILHKGNYILWKSCGHTPLNCQRGQSVTWVW